MVQDRIDARAIEKPGQLVSPRFRNDRRRIIFRVQQSCDRRYVGFPTVLFGFELVQIQSAKQIGL